MLHHFYTMSNRGKKKLPVGANFAKKPKDDRRRFDLTPVRSPIDAGCIEEVREAGGVTYIIVRGRDGPSEGLWLTQSRKGAKKVEPAVLTKSALVKIWWAEGRCLVCGSESHRRAMCPVVAERENKDCRLARDARRLHQRNTYSTHADPAPRRQEGPSTKKQLQQNRQQRKAGNRPPHQVPKAATKVQSRDPAQQHQAAPRASQGASQGAGSVPPGKHDFYTTSSSTRARGQKRERDQVSSGQTPPAKKVSHKFSYASAVSGSKEYAIVTQDNGNIPKEKFERIRKDVMNLMMAQITGGAKPLTVEEWRYTQKITTVHFADRESGKAIQSIVVKYNYKLIPAEELEAIRKPVKFLTALIRGAERELSMEWLARILKLEKDRRKIPGRIELTAANKVERSGNLILRILVDETAEERLKQLGFSITFGTNGRVKLEYERNPSKVDEAAQSLRAQLEELRKKQAEITSAIAEHESMLQGGEDNGAESEAIKVDTRRDTETPTAEPDQDQAGVTNQDENEKVESSRVES